MTSIRFDKFGGQIPMLDERLLPPENATYSENAFLQAGRLEPLAADISVHTLTDPQARYAFRVPKDNPGIDNIVDSYWIEFENPDTTVVRSPVLNQIDGGRYYWANTSGPPGYTTKQRIEGALPPLLLGIPHPVTAPGVTPSNTTTAPLETWAYVYTWVSGSFEEGQPSPPGLNAVNGCADNVTHPWTITFTPPTVSDMTNRDLQKLRVYRTVIGPDGTTGFFFVAELPIATTTFLDNVPGDQVASSEQLQSLYWSPPPSDLQGMVSMPNGMIAGWRANELWFCEPYRPHAWPANYTLGVDSPIVGLGTIDQNVMVLTSGQPYVAGGIHPTVMALRKVQPLEPCTSQGSIVSTSAGVFYTSYNGLMLIGPSGGMNVTRDTIRKDEWLRFLNLHTVHASYLTSGYYAYSGAQDGVFQDDAFQLDMVQGEDFKGTTVGAFIAADAHLGFMTLKCDSPTFNVMTDLWTGETFVIRDEQVFHVDRREYLPRQSYIWRSKIVQLQYKENLGAAKIFFDLPSGGPPSDDTTFKMYADGKLKMTRKLVKSGEQFRLPSGYKADFYQFELEGQLMVYNMQIASSARELRMV